jgi:serine phosphatase RsbU (regulator of sigma subunit)
MAPAAILAHLNAKAMDALPRGHFLALALVVVDDDAGTVCVANCSLPPILLCGLTGIRHHVKSDMFALGIMADASFEGNCEVLPFVAGDRLVIATDGVTEAVDRAGQAFGESRLEALLATLCQYDAAAPDVVCAALDAFRGDSPFADDVSVVELTLAAVSCAPTTPSVVPVLQCV